MYHWGSSFSLNFKQWLIITETVLRTGALSTRQTDLFLSIQTLNQLPSPSPYLLPDSARALQLLLPPPPPSRTMLEVRLFYSFLQLKICTHLLHFVIFRFSGVFIFIFFKMKKCFCCATSIMLIEWFNIVFNFLR